VYFLRSLGARAGFEGGHLSNIGALSDFPRTIDGRNQLNYRCDIDGACFEYRA
jgi:hypothetical protein